MEIKKNDINTRINEYLEDRGIKKKKLSEETKIPYQKVLRFFLYNAPISVVDYKKICAFLGLDLDYFLQEKQKEN